MCSVWFVPNPYAFMVVVSELTVSSGDAPPIAASLAP